jgi:hypothetical protein
LRLSGLAGHGFGSLLHRSPEAVIPFNLLTSSSMDALKKYWMSAGGPTGIAGTGMGGGCGVGVGLGWGYGSALGAHYIVVKPEFEKDNPVKPLWRIKLDNFLASVPSPFPKNGRSVGTAGS